MERRRSNRIIVRLEAEIISSVKIYSGFLEESTEFPGVSFYTYAGIIENLSSDGMLITISEKTELDLTPGAELEIAFQLPSGKMVNLHCMVKRLEKNTSSYDLGHSLGMVIIDPPSIYSKFLKAGLNQTK